jgi:hypothetical protein
MDIDIDHGLIESYHYIQKIHSNYDDIKNNKYKLEDFIVEDEDEDIKNKTKLYWIYNGIFLFICFILISLMIISLKNKNHSN